MGLRQRILARWVEEQNRKTIEEINRKLLCWYCGKDQKGHPRMFETKSPTSEMFETNVGNIQGLSGAGDK